MGKRDWRTKVALVLFLSLFVAAAAGDHKHGGGGGAGADFSVIVLPDTQNYSQYYPEIFAAQTQWIVAQRDALNIQLVIGVGDIVNDGSSDAQWQNADAAVKTLDQAGIPYVMAIGNHDYDGQLPQNRTATKFNQYMGPQRYAGYPWYHGENNYPAGSNENFYATLNMSGKDYLILVVEFVPRDSALDWARQVIAGNPDKEIILVTHSNMYGDNTRVDQCDTNDLNRDNDGEETWTKFVTQYSNISLVMSGHITTPTGRRTDLGANGNLVNQLLSNFQAGVKGGNGYLRILTFHPAQNSIDVQTYSPYIDSYVTDTADQFTWKWHNDGTLSGSPAVRGKVQAQRSGFSFSCSRISDANIAVSEGTLTQDSAGNFTVTLEPDERNPVTVTVSRAGYRSASQTLAGQTVDATEADFFLEPVTGTIGGRVKDANSGMPIAGAQVALSGGGIPYSKTYTANATGDYSSGPVPVGDYTLTVSADGYNTATVTGTASDGVRTTANVALQPSNVPPPPPPACTTNTNGVTICSPTNGATVASPVTVQAAAQSDAPIKFMQVYVDGALNQTVNASNISVQVTMTAGAHRVAVQAKDANGVILKNSVSVTVQ